METQLVVIKNQEITQVSSYKYLGVHIDNLLGWKTHIDNLCNRLQQRLYFLRRLRLYGVSSHIMMIFYRAIVESILRYGISSWFGNLTVKLKSKLAGMHKTAMKIVVRKEYEPIQSMYEQAVRKKSKENNFQLPTPTLPWIWNPAIREKTPWSNRLKLSFVPAYIKLMNNVQ